jgi:hypothetical protein
MKARDAKMTDSARHAKEIADSYAWYEARIAAAERQIADLTAELEGYHRRERIAAYPSPSSDLPPHLITKAV